MLRALTGLSFATALIVGAGFVIYTITAGGPDAEIAKNSNYDLETIKEFDQFPIFLAGEAFENLH